MSGDRAEKANEGIGAAFAELKNYLCYLVCMYDFVFFGHPTPKLLITNR